MRPSDTKKGSTPEHDEIHLWLHDIQNQTKLLDSVSGRKGVFPFKVKEKLTEHAIYGYKNYLLGIIDCIPEAKHEDDTQFLLCEFKPKLDSVSATLGQIKIYKEQFMNYCRETKGIYQPVIKSVVLTYDKETKYDKLFNSEGIAVFRVPTSQEIEEQKTKQKEKADKAWKLYEEAGCPCEKCSHEENAHSSDICLKCVEIIGYYHPRKCTHSDLGYVKARCDGCKTCDGLHNSHENYDTITFCKDCENEHTEDDDTSEDEVTHEEMCSECNSTDLETHERCSCDGWQNGCSIDEADTE